MYQINRFKLEKAIESTNGKFFSVKFIKKDKSKRNMNCRTSVKKYLKGGINKTVDISNGYKTVYDMQSKGYRTINLDTIYEFTFQGITYQVI